MSTEESVLDANNFLYNAPENSSVTTNRVLKRQMWQNRTYSEGQTATLILNTGTDMIDCINSSLNITIRVAPTAGATTGFSCGFGNGSGMNLIRNIRIYHRSGTAYTNTQRMNLYRKQEDVFKNSAQWFNTVGQIMGYGTGSTGITTEVKDTSVDYDIVIPLTSLHPFFDPEGSVFLPSAMASGLRVEIDLASLAEAFTSQPNGTYTAPSSYSITNIYLNTMSVAIFDNTMAVLNQVASEQALIYIYKDIFTSQNSQPSDSTSISVDINRSVGMADHAVTMIQLSSNLSSIFQDAFVSAYYPGSWWYQLGSNQYPNQRIDSTRGAYSTALITYDKFKSGNYSPSSVNVGAFALTTGIYAVTLERDTSLALSQSPVNASRSLRFEATLDAVIGAPALTTVFMTYVCECRSSLLSSKVDI